MNYIKEQTETTELDQLKYNKVLSEAPYLNEEQIRHASKLDVKNINQTWVYNERDKYVGPDITPQNHKDFKVFWYNEWISSNSEAITNGDISPYEAIVKANKYAADMKRYYAKMKKAHSKGKQYFSWKASTIGREPVLTEKRFKRFQDNLEKYSEETAEKLKQQQIEEKNEQ